MEDYHKLGVKGKVERCIEKSKHAKEYCIKVETELQEIYELVFLCLMYVEPLMGTILFQ